ncbi:MAG: hypothetical protein ABW352_10430 [Polyangiales bacterium]
MRPTYSLTSPVRAGLLTLGLLFAACGESGDGTVTGNDMGNANADDDEPEEKDSGVSECTSEGASRTCSCSNGKTGTRTCKSGKYSACSCTGGTGSDAGKPTVSNKCKPGYYTGGFRGKYRPGAFGFGLFASGFEVDIEGGKSFFDDSLPPLAFELTEEYAGSGEFQTFKVGGGCMQGIANAVVITQSPFVARLEGDLNCSTGEFKGTLTGYYTLIGIPGADFSFQGPLTAQFNFDNSTLDDGEWSVAEPPAADGNAAGGGEGTWDAKWTQEDAPIFENNPCDDIGPNGEHKPPTAPPTTSTPDAGTAPKSDAGTP